MKCLNCGFDSPSEMQYCGMCGARLARMCANCGFANPLNFRFCGTCGMPLQGPGESAPLPETPAKIPAGIEAAARTAKAPVEIQPEGVPKQGPALAPAPPTPVAAEAAPVVPGPAKLEGERRVATIILADVKESTDLLEQIGTEAWVEVMNRLFQILESEIYRFGGEVDQFRGDGLVAFFGARLAHEDDPERAVLAALAMQQAVKPYSEELFKREGINLSLRVGVNTGEVIVTSVGDDRQYREETAMGEAIAIAARMETAAEPGTVLVSENTYRLVATQFEWEPLGQIMVKGVSHPLVVYRPLALRTTVERPLSYGLSIPLIGRDAEFQTLRRSIEDLRDGRGGIVIVTGEKGTGKSFLVNEVYHDFARQGALLSAISSARQEPADKALSMSDRDLERYPSPAGMTWLYGRCRSYDQSGPYSMWFDLLQGWLGMRHEEPKEETRDRLRRRAEMLWGDHLAEHYPYLATFLSLPLEKPFAEPLKSLDAEGWQKQFFMAVRSWLEMLSGHSPLVLVFSDMQWADAASLALLKYCLPLCDNEPLLSLLVFRPDRTSPMWEFSHYVETVYPHRLTNIMMPAFTKAQSGEFIERLIGPDALPKETRELIINKAEGNPYYIQELIHSLIIRGALVQDAKTGQWRATRAEASVELPDSLQSLLLARIDSLSSEERHVLQMAAVIGTVFWLKPLEALAGKTVQLRAYMTSLQRAQLIQERKRMPDLGMEYAFNSTLIRDVAYESLLSAQRVTYHLKLAEYLENLIGLEGGTQYYGVLAYHYRCAGKTEKELTYTLQAAEQARRIYANAEALEHYSHALELLDKMETQAPGHQEHQALQRQRLEALIRRGEVFRLMGDLESWRVDAPAVLSLARQLDDPALLVDALLQHPAVIGWRTKEEFLTGVSMGEETLALSRKLGDKRREMYSLGTVAGRLYTMNDPTWQELGERALELARELGDQRYEVGLLTAIGGVYASSDPERSMEYLETALPICQALDDRRAELDLLSLIGRQLENSSDYYRRLKECEEKRLQISREIGDRLQESDSLMYCGQIRSIYLGDLEGGGALLEEGRQIIEGLPNELFFLLRMTQIQVLDGRMAEAQETLKRAHGIIDRNSGDIAVAGFRLVSAIFFNASGAQAAESGNLRQAEAHLHKALDMASQTRGVFVDNPALFQQYQMVAACESAAAHLALAHMVVDKQARQEHQRKALESSQAALDIYQSTGFVRPIECVSEEILFRHSKALAVNGQEPEALAFLKRAYDEMMHKDALIPKDSPFCNTYLENIPLHREIRTAYVASSTKTAWDGAKVTSPLNE